MAGNKQESPKGVSESCTDFYGNEEAKKERKVRGKREEGRGERDEVRGRKASGATTKKSRHQMPGKGRKKKAVELWGFDAWYVRDGDIWFDSVYHLSCPRDAFRQRLSVIFNIESCLQQSYDSLSIHSSIEVNQMHLELE